MEETTKHITIPPGMDKMVGGILDCWLMSRETHPDPYMGRSPGAMVYLGSIDPHSDKDGRVFQPTLSSLSESGRMLMAMLADNIPEAGEFFVASRWR